MSAPITRRTLFKATGLAAVGAGMAGCGNSGDSDSLSFMYWGSSFEDKAVRAMLDSFTEENDVDTEAIYVTGDYNTKVNTLVASDTTPDVAYMTASMGYRLAEQGKLINLYDHFDKHPELANRLPQTYFWYGPNKTFGTQTANEIIIIWYSKKAFDDAGIDTPPATAAEAWSWDDFVDTAIQLTIDEDGNNAGESGFDPKRIKQFGVTADITYRGVWYPLLLSNGGDIVDKSGRKCTLDSPEAIEVFQNLQDLIYEHHACPTPSQLTNAPGTQIQLQTGRIAMEIGGQWELLDIAQTPDLDFGVGVLPKYGDPITMSLGGASVIFSNSKQPDEALELYLFHNDPKHVDLYQTGLWMPLEQSYYTDKAKVDSWIDNDAHPSEFRTAVVDYTMNNAVMDFTQRIRNSDNLTEVITPALQQISTGDKSAAEVLPKLTADIDAKLQGWYPTQQL